MMHKTKTRCLILTLLITIILSSGCGGGGSSQQSTPSPILPTRTPFPPSPTPIPTAAVVNGDLITIAAYQEELARYKAAVNRELTEDDQLLVIHDLINLTLLAQAAASEGLVISESDLDNKIASLDTEENPLTDWLADFGFTQESFRTHLRTATEAAWMRDQIINDVPLDMEQIHAQQMLFYDQVSAETTLENLNSGKDFAELAKINDPQTRGDLGWFPRGYLTLPELDEILFSIEAGETSDIIETEIGYHIIKVLDIDTNRTVDPAIRHILQQEALKAWLERRWKLSTIDITLPS